MKRGKLSRFLPLRFRAARQGELEPAGQGRRAVRRREEPDSGSRPHAAGSADQARPPRHDDPRLHQAAPFLMSVHGRLVRLRGERAAVGDVESSDRDAQDESHEHSRGEVRADEETEPRRETNYRSSDSQPAVPRHHRVEESTGCRHRPTALPNGRVLRQPMPARLGPGPVSRPCGSHCERFFFCRDENPRKHWADSCPLTDPGDPPRARVQGKRRVGVEGVVCRSPSRGSPPPTASPARCR